MQASRCAVNLIEWQQRLWYQRERREGEGEGEHCEGPRTRQADNEVKTKHMGLNQQPVIEQHTVSYCLRQKVSHSQVQINSRVPFASSAKHSCSRHGWRPPGFTGSVLGPGCASAPGGVSNCCSWHGWVLYSSPPNTLSGAAPSVYFSTWLLESMQP